MRPNQKQIDDLVFNGYLKPTRYKHIFRVSNPQGVIVYKKVHVGPSSSCRRAVIELVLPYNTKVVIPTNPSLGDSNKCRAELAFTLALPSGTHFSLYNEHYYYRPNSMQKPHYFSLIDEACAAGIHFFFSREQAKAYH